MTWPWNKPKAPQPKLTWSSITLAEWRNSPPRIQFAQQLFRDQTFREMLSVVQNTLVIREPSGNSDLELGRALGHQDALTLFCSLAVSEAPFSPPEEVEMTYENPDLTQEEGKTNG